MQVSNGILLASRNAVGTLIAAKLPIPKILAIRARIHSARAALEAITAEQDKITQNEIVKDEAGNPVHPNGDVKLVMLTPEGVQHRDELMQLTSEIPGEPIELTPQMLENGLPGQTFSVNDLDLISWLVKFTEAAAE
jgi:hypothetical protein